MADADMDFESEVLVTNAELDLVFSGDESPEDEETSPQDGAEADSEEEEECDEDEVDIELDVTAPLEKCDDEDCFTSSRPSSMFVDFFPEQTPPDQQDNIDGLLRDYDMFKDYFGLNSIVLALGHDYLVSTSPTNEEVDQNDIGVSFGAIGGRRRNSDSSSNSAEFYEHYGNDSPPYSPSAHLQDYFVDRDFDRTGGGRRDLAMGQRRVKFQAGSRSSYQGPQQQQRPSVCVFCRNNGEAESLYNSHALKDHTGKVTCPILRAYTCPVCKASGDSAHTLKYCPKNESPSAKQAQAAAAIRGSGRPGPSNLAGPPRRRDKLPSVGSHFGMYH